MGMDETADMSFRVDKPFSGEWPASAKLSSPMYRVTFHYVGDYGKDSATGTLDPRLARMSCACMRPVDVPSLCLVDGKVQLDMGTFWSKLPPDRVEDAVKALRVAKESAERLEDAMRGLFGKD